MKKISSVKKVQIKASPVHYITGVVFIALIIFIISFAIKPKEERILLKNDTIEKNRLATAYVLKYETVIEKNLNKVLLPVIAEGTKTKKGGIIATYKGEEYKNYEETLNKMDNEILDLMNDLPITYSSEVEAIDNLIYALVKQSQGETSYAKMQEYKQRINTHINKRANIIGELSPDGAKIRELIEQRNKYEDTAKKSNDNVLAPTPGIVSYKTDGLETKLSAENTEKLFLQTMEKESHNPSYPISASRQVSIDIQKTTKKKSNNCFHQLLYFPIQKKQYISSHDFLCISPKMTTSKGKPHEA